MRLHTHFDRKLLCRLCSCAWTCLQAEVRRLLGRDDVQLDVGATIQTHGDLASSARFGGESAPMQGGVFNAPCRPRRRVQSEAFRDCLRAEVGHTSARKETQRHTPRLTMPTTHDE